MQSKSIFYCFLLSFFFSAVLSWSFGSSSWEKWSLAKFKAWARMHGEDKQRVPNGPTSGIFVLFSYRSIILLCSLWRRDRQKRLTFSWATRHQTTRINVNWPLLFPPLAFKLPFSTGNGWLFRFTSRKYFFHVLHSSFCPHKPNTNGEIKRIIRFVLTRIDREQEREPNRATNKEKRET